METAAAAAMLEAGVGRFSRAPALAAALLAEMWAPLAVALAALATLPSLLRRLQVIVLRIRSRGKEAIQSRISTYYSSGDEDDDEDRSSSDDEASSDDDDDDDEEEEKEEDVTKRIGYLEEEDGGGCCFPWGGAVVRTWQGLPRRFNGRAGFGCSGSGAGVDGRARIATIRLWGASTASGEPWLNSGNEDGASSEADAEDVVVGWSPGAHRRRRCSLRTKCDDGHSVNGE